MYEQNFGLNKRPFPALATGADVFVGPQTAKTMAGFRKALATRDAVVVVSGPAGTGKTTLVHRALEGIGSKYKTIRVGRMRMDANDVLESLLVVLGVQDRPAGVFQRFSALRKKLSALQEAEVQVFIVVEEALRTGTDTLAELEALTAADAGESDGASIILMGDERITDFMKEPQLGQLQQRVRQRHRIAPLCAAEMRGYLMHGFRQAGGDFEQLFDDRSSDLLHQLSGGIPRIANNLIESVMTAAAAQGMKSIAATFIATIASDEFGLEADDFDFSTPESGLATECEAIPETKTQDAPDDEDDIPDLIQDTLPDLEILSPQFATLETQAEPQATEAAEPEESRASEEIPEPVVHTEAEPVELVIPELTPEPLADAAPEPVAEEEPPVEDIPQPVAEEEPPVADIAELVAEKESPVEDIPELVAEEESPVEDIPKLVAEEGPPVEDIPELVAEEQLLTEEEPLVEDILSLALEPDADFAPLEVAAESETQPVVAEPKPDLEALEQAMAFAHGASEDNNDLPEITLDKSIETGIGNPFAEEPEETQSPEPDKMPGIELDKIAVDIGNAKTLEDINDKMAETLFGTGLGMIAAQMIANPPGGAPANDDLPVEPTESVASAPLEEISLESIKPTATSSIELTSSQRLKMARALNTDLRKTPSDPGASQAKGNGVAEIPKPIEDQIDTSLTNTLKALKVPTPPVDDEPEERTKTGFFSRFRRS